MRKQGNCLEKEITQGTMPGARRRGRPRTAWIDNIKSWTGLSVEESVRMTEDIDSERERDFTFAKTDKVYHFMTYFYAFISTIVSGVL